MSDGPQGEDPNSKKAKAITGKSPMRIALGRIGRDWIAMICLGVVIFFALVAIFAAQITDFFGVTTDTVFPSQYLELDGLPKEGPPNHGYDPEHPFGIAPQTAVDNLAYWVYGCRNSLQIAVIATIVASTIGITLGLISGFLGGMVDRSISFVVDFFLTIPFLLAALSIAPIINERYNGSDNYEQIQVTIMIMVLALFSWMGVARLIRGEVFSLREREFIMASRVLGMPTHRVLIRELLPNLAAPIVVTISLMLPAFIAAEAGLAFLGIGVTTRPSWGRIIDQAVKWWETYPLYLLEPLVGIIALVLALNLLGDAIRDAMDPKTRR